MRPLILDYQINRIESEDSTMIPYAYDHTLSLSIVINSGESLIDAAAYLVNDGTSTRKAREQDDYDSRALLGTDTKRSRENSDHLFSLVELKTKTFTAREADDERLTDN